MNQIVFTAWVLLFPAACTTLGAAGVFLLRRRSRPCTQRILCGHGQRVSWLAASVWSCCCLLSSADRLCRFRHGIPIGSGACAGRSGPFAGGTVCRAAAGRRGRARRTYGAGCNIAQPARGYGGGPCRCTGIDRGAGCHQRCTGAELGIGLQNIPEGAAVSLPLAHNGRTRSQAFLRERLPLVEPLGALLAFALAEWSVLRFRGCSAQRRAVWCA